ncbi:MAG: hypothetical protein ACTHLN_15460 [Tepidisphaeraceae bacterium]
MHEINDIVVRQGKIELTDLPFSEGQHVHVIISATPSAFAGQRMPIDEIRRKLKGKVERFDQPFEPVIPDSDWEMLK